MIIHTPQKSTKRKPSAKARALRASWEKLIADTTPKKPVILKKNKPLRCSYSIPEGRGTRHIPSVTTDQHSTQRKETTMYTGDNMLGITILHKSCLQPVFSKQEAIEVSQMRRG